MDSYNADSIKVLEGLEAVRARPAMYIGSTTQRGLNHLIYEIVDNSVDEHLQGYGDTISVTIFEDGSCMVRDCGRGIPTDIHETGIPAERVILTTLHAGGKFDSSSYKISSGLHGVGSSVVNALSEWMKVNVYRDGYHYMDSYERGIPTMELENCNLPSDLLSGGSKITGTSIAFMPDREIFGNLEFKCSDIKNRLHEICYLNPNLTINFEDQRNSDDSISFHEPNGLIQYVKDLNGNEDVVSEPYYFSGTYEEDGSTIEVEVAFQYIHSLQEKIIGFCNSVHTQEGGTHITGLKTTLTGLINSYARELGILKDKDANFTGSDVRSGLTAVVAVKHPDPIFEGQTKTKLDNIDAQKAVNAVCSKELTLFFDKNLNILKQVISIAEKSSNFRKSEEKSKNSLFNTKKKFSFESNGKLANCESRDYSKCELLIVEGDSAAGSAKMGRDRKYQAILPLRGKVLNVEKATMDKVVANDIIKTLIYALGCGFSEGYGNDFDISKLKYDKIIILADADQDGKHITTLILIMLYRLMPELIYDGHVYVAVSPLYKASTSNGEEKYLYDDSELEEYSKTNKSFTLQRYKGLGEMSPDQLWDTTLNPEHRILKRIFIEDEMVSSKTTSDLMGSDVEPRKKFIKEMAEYAEYEI